MRRRRDKSRTPYDENAGAGLQHIAGGGRSSAAGGVPPASRPEPAEPCPPTSVGGALAVTVFCCMPFGLVSLAWAFTTRRRWRHGDQYGAEHASRMAELWMFAGVGIFVVTAAIAVVVAIVQALLPA